MTLINLLKEATIAPLYEARNEADEALRRAVFMTDTQAVKEARRRMREATHAVMAAELSLRGWG